LGKEKAAPKIKGDGDWGGGDAVSGQDSKNVAVVQISVAEIGNIFDKSRCSLKVILNPREKRAISSSL